MKDFSNFKYTCDVVSFSHFLSSQYTSSAGYDEMNSRSAPPRRAMFAATTSCSSARTSGLPRSAAICSAVRPAWNEWGSESGTIPPPGVDRGNIILNSSYRRFHICNDFIDSRDDDNFRRTKAYGAHSIAGSINID